MNSGVVAIAIWTPWAIWLTGRPPAPLWRWWANVAIAIAGTFATYVVAANTFNI